MKIHNYLETIAISILVTFIIVLSGFNIVLLIERQNGLGATITTMLSTDTLKDSRAVINTNLDNLNEDKLENSNYYATTTHAIMTTIPNLSITESQISDLSDSFSFDTETYGVSTSTIVGFTGGMMSMASSTFTDNLHLSILNCDTIDTDGVGLLSCGTDAGGGTGDPFAWTVEDGAVSTSTEIWFGAGLISQASSTFTSNVVFLGTGHDTFSDFVANEHLDWTASVGTIHADNYTNTTYTAGDFAHDSLASIPANDHLDWTTNVGTIDTGNYIENIAHGSIEILNALFPGETVASTSNITDDIATHLTVIADTSTIGHLNDTDWDTFNNKQPALGFTAMNVADWTTINNYPNVCPGGEFVSAIGDTLTCSVPAGGGGSTLHVDGTGFVYPQTGDYHSAPKYVATSSEPSTFNNASSTLFTFTTGWGTNLNSNVTGDLTGNADTCTTSDSDGTWTLHDNYPNACGAGEYVTSFTDTLSCVDATTEINSVVNGLGGTNLTCAAQSCDVTDAWWDADGDISVDTISESKIIFSTACAAGNHYYLNGNDLACEADANNTYTGGTSITLNGSAFDVDDDFLKLGGDIASAGTYDFGSASVVLEIPNATAPTANAAGEMHLDTTDNQLVIADSGNTARVFGFSEQRLFAFTIASSSVDFISGGIIRIPKNTKDGRDITQFRCSVEAGTSVVVNISDGTNDTETITCTTSQTSDTDVATNSTFTADELWEVQIGTVTGNVDRLAFEAYGYIIVE